MNLPYGRVGVAVVLGALSPIAVWSGVGPAPSHARQAVPPDSAALVAEAHGDQADYERDRLVLAPEAGSSADGPCDERIGRFCFTFRYGGRPPPESPRVVHLRDRLLARLDSIGARIPGDDWVLGQRVWYRAAAGHWGEALDVARACGGATPWWCAALRGFALHGLGRYRAAGRAFARALALMGSARARSWRIPARSLDPQARRLLEGAPPDSLAARLARLWMLADPLYLVPGNDRETAYYARRTVAAIRRHAGNPYQLSWEPDLDEILLRYGWEVRWQHEPIGFFGGFPDAVGYEAPQGRTYMPPGAVLDHPVAARPRDLEADLDHPRSLYSPAYAPVLLPIEPQVALFPRGDSFAVVTTAFLPRDTTRYKGGAVPNPMDQAVGLAKEPDQAGLFLVPLAGGPPRSDTRRDSTSGAFLVRAPAGRYLISSESWSPRRRRAGRYRAAVVEDSIPLGVPALSDLLLMHAVDSTRDEPRTLAAALPRVLRRPIVVRGEPIAVGWELTGLVGTAPVVTYRLSVVRRKRSLLDRARGWLHLGSPGPSLSLYWREPAPPAPRPRLHWLALHVPGLKPGRYEVRLEARLPGRGPLVSVRAFRVR